MRSPTGFNNGALFAPLVTVRSKIFSSFGGDEGGGSSLLHPLSCMSMQLMKATAATTAGMEVHIRLWRPLGIIVNISSVLGNHCPAGRRYNDFPCGFLFYFLIRNPMKISIPACEPCLQHSRPLVKQQVAAQRIARK
ncbi:MAG: hypothetical protein ACOZF0_14760 [Thermodesulfobacteriota bacterium]